MCGSCPSSPYLLSIDPPAVREGRRGQDGSRAPARNISVGDDSRATRDGRGRPRGDEAAVSPPRASRGDGLQLPAPLEHALEVADGDVALLVGEGEDVLEGLADRGEVLLDVGALLQLVLDAAVVAQMDAEAPAALLEGEAQLLDDLWVMGDGLLALGGERNPDRRDVDEEDHRSGGRGSLRL